MGVFIYNLTEGTAVKNIAAKGPFGAQCLELQAVCGQVTADKLLGQNPCILLHLHVTSAQTQAGDHKAGSDGLTRRRQSWTTIG